MRLLFLSNYFPPEVNAPATRLYEHARQWVADGHEVEVLTSVPNFPEGEVYDGYDNRPQYDEMDGIPTLRVPMYVAENKGALKRTLSYVSFMVTACLFSRRIRGKPDVVVATSPQFFCALAGYFISRFYGVPFVMEVRDLWPESIVAVGAMERNALIRTFERLERFLYRKSAHVVVVTNAFKRHVVEQGIEPEKVTVLKNGFDPRSFDQKLDPARLDQMRREFELEDKFVVSYIGTIGMAHRVDVMLDAAQRCDDPDVVFMIVGTGAAREALEARQAELQLPNVRLVDKQPKEMVPYLLALTDASVVHLKASPLFKTVIPSKIFEAMATHTPIVLGVEGETREIIEEAGAGIPITPEDPEELVAAVRHVKQNPDLHLEMGRRGHTYVCTHHDRRHLARRYWSVLEQVAGLASPRQPRMELLDRAA